MSTDPSGSKSTGKANSIDSGRVRSQRSDDLPDPIARGLVVEVVLHSPARLERRSRASSSSSQSYGRATSACE